MLLKETPAMILIYMPCIAGNELNFEDSCRMDLLKNCNIINTKIEFTHPDNFLNKNLQCKCEFFEAVYSKLTLMSLGRERHESTFPSNSLMEKSG